MKPLFAAITLVSVLAGSAHAEKVLANVKVGARGHSRTTYGALVPHPADRAAAHAEAMTQLHAEGASLQALTPGATRYELKITEVKHGAEFIHHEFFKSNDRYATTDVNGKVVVYGN